VAKSAREILQDLEERRRLERELERLERFLATRRPRAGLLIFVTGLSLVGAWGMGRFWLALLFDGVRPPTEVLLTNVFLSLVFVGLPAVAYRVRRAERRAPAELARLRTLLAEDEPA